MNQAIELLNNVIKEKKIKKIDLAKKLKLDYSHLVASLKYDKNMSLNTYLILLKELGYEIEIKQIKQNISNLNPLSGEFV